MKYYSIEKRKPQNEQVVVLKKMALTNKYAFPKDIDYDEIYLAKFISIDHLNDDEKEYASRCISGTYTSYDIRYGFSFRNYHTGEYILFDNPRSLYWSTDTSFFFTTKTEKKLNIRRNSETDNKYVFVNGIDGLLSIEQHDINMRKTYILHGTRSGFSLNSKFLQFVYKNKGSDIARKFYELENTVSGLYFFLFEPTEARKLKRKESIMLLYEFLDKNKLIKQYLKYNKDINYIQDVLEHNE